jgi:dTDP-4-amino-4,6-dideoxygalactose transaminase
VSQGEISFLDLSRQLTETADELRDAFQRFLLHGNYILGPEVKSLEAEFASYCGSGEGIGVASGTDALVLAMKALGLQEGDEVVTTAFSAPPTAVGIALAGGHPVFVDIDPATYNLDPALFEKTITPRCRFLLVVHLYGCVADMPAIVEMAERHGLILVEDCAQAHGASLQGRMAGTWGRAGCYSFYPTKNLGAYGDGGMVITSDAELARRLRSLRDYGKVDRNQLGEIGFNSRLDEVQAAFLRIKLRYLDAWNDRRRQLASRYLEGLEGLPLQLPSWSGAGDHCFHLFVVSCADRDALRLHLEKEGIGSAIHYPIPLPLLNPFRSSQPDAVSCPIAEHAAGSVLSLPLYPQLTDGEQEKVIDAVRDFFNC